MNHDRELLFSFREADHLTRLHLRLGLEDLGFVVEEDNAELNVVDAGVEPGGGRPK